MKSKHTPTLKKVASEHLFHSPNNPRHQPLPDDPKVQELSDSIRSVGLLQPILASKVGPFKHFIIAGARRFEAAKLAGMGDIPCMVYDDLSTDEELAMTVTENLQRQDLTPLEEGHGIASLVESGRSTEEIAADLAKSTTWVRRRAKLTHLSPLWQEAVARGPYQDMSAAHLELIAHLPMLVQDKILTEIGEQSGITVKTLKYKIRIYSHNLAAAPFPKKKCEKCEKRTDREPDLFAGIDQDSEDDARCLDDACWDAECAAHVEKQKKAIAKKTGRAPVLVTGNYTSEENVVREWNTEECEEDDPGAVPAMMLDGETAGELYWIKDPKAEQEDTQEPPQRPEATLEQKRLVYMISEFNKWLESTEKCPVALKQPIYMLAALAVFGSYYRAECETAKDFDKLTEDDGILEESWKVLKPRLDMYCPDPEDADQVEDDQRAVLELRCHILGQYIAEFEQSAAIEFPEPKKGKRK